MNIVPKDDTAASRARWLAELAEALEAAQQVMSKLCPRQLQSPEGVELRARLAAALAQLRGIRLGRVEDGPREIDPDRTELLWPGGAGRPRR